MSSVRIPQDDIHTHIHSHIAQPTENAPFIQIHG